MSSEWRPRIVLDVSPELLGRVQEAFPHGTRNAILVSVVEQLTEAIETEGKVIAYLILNGKLKLFSVSNIAERILR